MSESQAILTVRNLRTWFFTQDGVAKAVDDVSFAVGRQQCFALVGESGCGKSVTALSIMRLVADPPGKILHKGLCGRFMARARGMPSEVPDSSIVLDGVELLRLSERQMRSVRGSQVAMIFQEPMTSLNPVYTSGNQIVEAIQLHQKLSSPSAARALAIEMLSSVGIPDPIRRYDEYPHQLSGGMRQRVMMAMALSCNPKLLIADEPTTALDVTIQAQILDLLKGLQAQRGLSILLITHDLAVVAENADVVAVMYASKLAELAGVRELFARPLHPYTQGLFRSLPRIGQKKDRLATIPGAVPNPLAFPAGCKFHTRCDLTSGKAGGAAAADTVVIEREGQMVPVLKRCACQEPPLREVSPKHWVACWECPRYDSAPATDPSAEPIRERDSQIIPLVS